MIEPNRHVWDWRDFRFYRAYMIQPVVLVWWWETITMEDATNVWQGVIYTRNTRGQRPSAIIMHIRQSLHEHGFLLYLSQCYISLLILFDIHVISHTFIFYCPQNIFHLKIDHSWGGFDVKTLRSRKLSESVCYTNQGRFAVCVNAKAFCFHDSHITLKWSIPAE